MYVGMGQDGGNLPPPMFPKQYDEQGRLQTDEFYSKLIAAAETCNDYPGATPDHACTFNSGLLVAHQESEAARALWGSVGVAVGLVVGGLAGYLIGKR